MSASEVSSDDASLIVRWRQPARKLSDGAGLVFVPARVRAAGGFDFIAAPGELTSVPPGQIVLEVEAPGYSPLTLTTEVATGERYEAELSEEMLTPREGAIGSEDAPRAIAVEVLPWSPPVVPLPVRKDDVELRAIEGGFAIARKAAVALSAGIELATRTTPRRLLAVPPVAAGDDYQVMWYRPPYLARRPRIEPVDPGGRLLMVYLIGGRYRLAAAAARGVERARGHADPLAWVTPSYTQLLIGYSYALGEDRWRLSAWCERTAASTELGSDGLVLAADSAWQHGRAREARDLLVRADQLPTVTLGGEMGVRLATLIIAMHVEPDQALLAVVNRWLPVLTRADGNAVNLSVAATATTSPDVEAASRLNRLRWLVRYALSRWRYVRLRRYPTVFALIKEKSMYRVPVATLLLLAVLTLVVGLSLWFDHSTSGPNTWLAIGALQALVFLAIGALAGSYHLRRMLEETRIRLLDAEEQTRIYHEAAMKGRALAAVLYAAADTAEATDADRYARIAHELFRSDNPATRPTSP